MDLRARRRAEELAEWLVAATYVNTKVSDIKKYIKSLAPDGY
jgi:hypothetical protein